MSILLIVLALLVGVAGGCYLNQVTLQEANLNNGEGA